MANTYPKIINHVGISVPDLEKAIVFYRKVFGFNIIKGPIEVIYDSPKIGSIFKNIFGPLFRKAKVVWLSSGNNVGLEIFEFIKPKAEQHSSKFEYWKSGLFHLCITDPNIEDLRKKILENDGKLSGEIQIVDQQKQHKLAYCEDPFGNIIEIFTHSYEQFNANT